MWFARGNAGPLQKLDLNTGEVKTYPLGKHDDFYGMNVDFQGRSIMNVWQGGKIGFFDPKNGAIH